MNCKPGDLAVIVAGFPENVGGLVRVIAIDPLLSDLRPWWQVETLSTLVYALEWSGNQIVGSIPPGSTSSVADEHIRPIRDQDGDDETLIWAGKPEKVTA